MTVQQKIGLYVVVFIAAFAAVFIMDSITPEYETEFFTGETDVVLPFQGDQSDYVKLAEDFGISDGDVLGPFAYRIIPGVIAAAIAAVTNSHVVDGYHIMTFIGLGLQLVMCFVVAREVGANIWQSFFVMLIVALSLGNVRSMTYDYIRPDAVAFPWMLGVIWLILRGKLHTAMILSWVGVIAREYFLIPAGIISVYHLWQAYEIFRDTENNQALWKPLIFAVLSSLGAIVVFWIPRMLISVPDTYQFIETTDQGGLWDGLLFTIQSGGRNKNYIMAFAGYMFPTALLFSIFRWKNILPDLKRVFAIVFLYSAGIMLLSYIGGLDFLRFTAYMVVPQVILLAVFLKNGVFWWELVYLVFMWGWYNRVHQAITPLQENMREYIIFISPWGMSVPIEVSNHFKLAVLFIVILWAVRFAWYAYQKWFQPQKAIAISTE